jgi:hypothetical protein
MRRDTKLLSKGTWALAVADQLKDRGITVPRPRVSVLTSRSNVCLSTPKSVCFTVEIQFETDM